MTIQGGSQFTNTCVDISNNKDNRGGGGVQVVYSSYKNTYSPSK